jgi:hypothetical protein
MREQNGQLFNNTSYTPLDSRRAVAATPVQNVARNRDVYFRYDSTLFITHNGSGNPYPLHRMSVAVDFDDGNGYVHLTHGQIYHVNYPAEGMKRLRFQLTYTPPAHPFLPVHPQVSYTQAWFYVAYPRQNNNNNLPTLFAYNDSIPDLVLDVQATQSLPGTLNWPTATVNITYSNFPAPLFNRNNVDSVLDKPLIVLEGLDIEGMLEGGDNNFLYKTLLTI